LSGPGAGTETSDHFFDAYLISPQRGNYRLDDQNIATKQSSSEYLVTQNYMYQTRWPQ